jgi:hypothetical protein
MKSSLLKRPRIAKILPKFSGKFSEWHNFAILSNFWSIRMPRCRIH